MFSAFSKPQYPQDNFLKIGQCNFHTQTVEFSANSASNQNSQIQCKVCVLQKIELVQILLARSHSAKCIILVKIQCKFCPQVKMQLVQSTWSKKTSAISFKVLVQSMQCKFPSVKSVEPRKNGFSAISVVQSSCFPHDMWRRIPHFNTKSSPRHCLSCLP